MVIGIFGESCTGKSTLADKLKARLDARVFTGKDYLRLEKNPDAAKQAFQQMLAEALHGTHIIYVIAEPEHLPLLPEDSVRVLVTADLETIKERFSVRMRGNLPGPVAAMLEKKHGCFDGEPHDVQVVSRESDLEAICEKIAAMCL